MLTFKQCAEMAFQSYYSYGSVGSWKRINGPTSGSGFAACCYVLGNTARLRQRGGLARPSNQCNHDEPIVVVVYRGTDDFDDVLSDLRMIPEIEQGKAQEAMNRLLKAYGNTNNLTPRLFAALFEVALSMPSIRSRVRRYANRVPPDQGRKALAFFDRQAVKPSVVVGHSLGGALAKYVSNQRDVTCVAFNSPYMGMLHGMHPTTSFLITSINAHLDPLSFLTKAVGNLSHGREILVEVPPRQRSLLRKLFDFWLDSGMTPTELLQNMLHYHSMDNLRKAMRHDARFQKPMTIDW